MPTRQHVLPVLSALLLAAPSALPAGEIVTDKVDGPTFLARHDLIFETLPTQFDYGAFLGNGMLGATIYRDGDNRLRFEMGRADVNPWGLKQAGMKAR